MSSYKKYTGCKYIDPYINKIKNNETRHCEEQELMIDNIVLPVLSREDVFIHEEKIKKGLELQKYFNFRLIEWEVFLFALIAGVFYKSGDIFFKDIRVIVGRGAGKNGFISFLCFYFLSPAHGVPGYNIDILANTENQAKTSFNDCYEAINNPVDSKLKRALLCNFNATKTEILGKKTGAILRYNSSSKRGKDSKRTGCAIYDEKHEYTDASNINTLRSGLGKVPFGREITITTNGHIRGGVLDDELAQNADILKEYNPENRTLVFWCKIEKEEEWKDEEAWIKANPSVNDFPELRATIKKEVQDMPYNLTYFPEFMAKRMNFPIGNKDVEVVNWEDIKATNKELPDLAGLSCVAGIDYAKTNDFVAACLLFKIENMRYAIIHGWVCSSSKDLPGIKAPWQDWAKRGLITVVNDVEISAEIVTDWLAQQGTKYVIEKIAIDSFRFSYFNLALKNIGFDAYEAKNVKLIRPSDLMRAYVTLNSIFVNHYLAVGDNPYFRWNVNNTKKITDTRGNISYGKIEPRYRKTDAFMAFAAAQSIEDCLPEAMSSYEVFEPLIY